MNWVGRLAAGIQSFQGRFVGKPKASELKKFPQRPMAWPSTTEGNSTSMSVQKDSRRQRQKTSIARVPPIRAPWMAMPPFQISRASSQLIWYWRHSNET